MRLVTCVDNFFAKRRLTINKNYLMVDSRTITYNGKTTTFYCIINNKDKKEWVSHCFFEPLS